MSGLTEVQQGWLQELRQLVGKRTTPTAEQPDAKSADAALPAGEAGAAHGAQALFDTPVNSAKNANVKLVPHDKLGLPPVDNLDLPSVENNLVDIQDRKTGVVEKMLYSELRDSAYYVDNGILSLTAQPTVTTLTVKWMRLAYSGGRKLGIPMERVTFGSLGRATSYERQKGFIVPLDADGEIRFDRNNTPNVVICAQWVRDELLRRSQQRVEIAELVATFAAAVAGLASASPGAHGVKVGGPPVAATQIGGRTGSRAKVSGSGASRSTPAAEKPAQSAKPGQSEKPASEGSSGSRPAPSADPTPAAPPRRPERGHPLDSTPAVKRPGGDTVDTSSPKGGAPRNGPVAGEVLTPRPIEPTPRIPDAQQISIRTAKGPAKMTVGEYRRRWQAARQWLSQEHVKTNARKNVPESAELIKQAQQKFGLDDGWLHVGNPYIYGKL